MPNNRVKPLFEKLIRAFTQVIIVFLGIVLPSFGQLISHQKPLSHYYIEYWDTPEGLPSSSILDLIQDEDGYLWIATYRGLVRFDGDRFVTFDKFNTDFIEQNGIRCFLKTQQGDLWIGSNGDGIYLYRNQEFQKFSKEEGVENPSVYDLFQDEDGTIWAGTKGGVIFLEKGKETFQKIKVAQSQDEYLSIASITQGKNGTIWVGTELGLYYVNQNGLLAPYGDLNDPNRLRSITDVMIDRSGRVWVASYSNGLFFLKDGKLEKLKITDGIERISMIYEDQFGALFLCSDFGLYRVYQGTLSLIDESTGLKDNNVNCVYVDKEGSMWTGTYYGGLHRIKDVLFENYTQEDGLLHQTVHAIYQENDSVYWICNDNGINQIINGKLVVPKEINRILPGTKARDVYRDSKGDLWIAVYGGIVRKTGNSTQVFTQGKGLVNDQVRLIYEDTEGRLWFGTRGGLNLWQNGTFKNYSTKNGFVNDFITGLLQDKNDTLWIATTAGLHYLNTENDSIVAIQKPELQSALFRIHQDETGRLWVGSANGLVTYFQGQSFSFSKTDNWLGGTIYQVIEDKQGFFWLTCGEGIIKVARQNLMDHLKNPSVKIQSVLLGQADGLRSKECTATSRSIQATTGKLWFAMLNSVAIINPYSAQKNDKIPTVLLEEIRVNDSTYQKVPEKVEVSPLIKRINLKFTGLSLVNPRKVRFKSRLIGYEDDWNDLLNKRETHYTNILPGEYTFKVIACNNDGLWNFEGASLKIIVKPPFWQTSWFFWSCMVGTGLFGFVFYKLRVRSIKKYNALLEDKVKLRTEEIQQQKEEIQAQRDDIEVKNKELESAHRLIEKQFKELETVNSRLESRVKERTQDLEMANKELDEFVYKASHDIKGPLARISGLCQLALLETEDEVAQLYIKKLQQEAFLTNDGLKKLIKTRNVKNSDVHLSQFHLLDTFKEAFSKLKADKELQEFNLLLNFDQKICFHTDWFLVRTAIYYVLENALAFHSPTLKPEVRVNANIDRKNSFCRIWIEDNGMGIEKGIWEDIFKMFFKGTNRSEGPGLGLYIARMALEKINGTVKVIYSEPGKTVFELLIKDQTENLDLNKLKSIRKIPKRPFPNQK